uniref:Uncharacterized protein n=1 Tax=uncultured bacterium Contig643 TaxID=1393602 RepID=W0FM38_9BACT|nr:hypothetical protein [uncultured bacterium Contig643]
MAYYNKRCIIKTTKREENKEMASADKMIDMIAEAYIKVMGIEKWNSLSDNEKYEAVMTMARDLDKALR